MTVRTHKKEEEKGMKMSKTCSSIVVTAVAMMLVAPTGNAADVTVGAGLNSAYVWRGVTVNEDLVVQPSIDVAHPNGWGANVWGNWDVGDNNNQIDNDREFSEVDVTLSYNVQQVEQANLTIGNITYAFPSPQDADTRETNEIFLKLDKGRALGEGEITGSFGVYYDWDQVDDYYGDVGVTYSHPASDQLSVDLSAQVGFAGSDFAGHYGKGTSSGLFNWNATIALNYAVNESVAVSGFIAHTDSADSSVLGSQKTEVDVYGGVSANYAF